MFALSHCPVSPCPIVLDFVSSGACLSCCPSLCLFFEGYVVRVLSSFFSLRTVSSPALQRLVFSSLARADFPPYSTSLCCAERAAVGSPTTSSTRRTTHHLTSVEHADPAERLRVTGIIHIDIGITWRGLQARAEALGKGERATCGRQNLFRRRPAITCPSRPVGPHPPVFSTRHRRTSIA